LDSFTKLREAFKVFLLLAVIAFFNVGQLWERRKVSAEYINVELIQLLELDQDQMKKIQAITKAFDSKWGKIHTDKLCNEETKNKQIMEVLSETQQKVLYAYCTDLLSFDRSF
jgi:biopolymer transport protein ExbB/TolQ